MTDLARYYDASVPPAVLPFSKGATAGIPGAWTPAGSIPPADPAALMAGKPVPVTPVPATAWTTGQYVQTRLAGAPGRATWTGTAWVGGVAADEASAPQEGETVADWLNRVTVADVLTQIDAWDVDELQTAIEVESANKNRSTLLAALNDELAERQAGEQTPG